MIEIKYRKIVSSIALFISMLLVFCFYGCRTSTKTIEKSRIEIEKKELQINKIDSSVAVHKNNTLKKVDSLSWFNSMKYFDLSYSGIDKDDYLEFTKTEKGFKLSGKGNVNIKNSENKGDSIQKSNNHQLTNELSKVNSSLKTEVESNNHQIKVEKEKEKFSVGPTFGILLLALIILIYYLIKRFKY
ncbi:hypothetical protein [Chishuiella changwenlii]|uniref:hypothetical protein n=1 Tax=Chishuiella changwenlii TaxID=1434701 RepID=UPI002FDA3004